MPKRPLLQDRDISQITSNITTKRVYLTLHFVTAEFDYDTGRAFAAQLLEQLERIAPDGPTTTHQTERDRQPSAVRVQREAAADWRDLE